MSGESLNLFLSCLRRVQFWNVGRSKFALLKHGLFVGEEVARGNGESCRPGLLSIELKFPISLKFYCEEKSPLKM